MKGGVNRGAIVAAMMAMVGGLGGAPHWGPGAQVTVPAAKSVPPGVPAALAGTSAAVARRIAGGFTRRGPPSGRKGLRTRRRARGGIGRMTGPQRRVRDRMRAVKARRGQRR